jgi:uncharacterized protein (TIGR03435 family)
VKVLKRLLFFAALPIAIGFIVRTEMLSRPQAASEPFAFEVASIKPNDTHARIMSMGCHGSEFPDSNGRIALGRCRFVNVPLKILISYAYDAHPEVMQDNLDQMIVNAPDWASVDAFDIDAKAENPSATTTAQLKLMLRALLAERFKLQFHRGTKEVPGLELQIAKDGSKLRLTSGGPRQGAHFSAVDDGLSMTIYGASAFDLGEILSSRLHRLVVDKTGLTGIYDVKLSWSPGEDEGVPAYANPSMPSLFVALQEQLGLRLETGKTTMDVLVIDHLEKPPLD